MNGGTYVVDESLQEAVECDVGLYWLLCHNIQVTGVASPGPGVGHGTMLSKRHASIQCNTLVTHVQQIDG